MGNQYVLDISYLLISVKIYWKLLSVAQF